MKLINQSVELVTEENPLKCVELAGRVSHKSEDRITNDSHKAFIKQMLKLGHTATLEFGSVYINVVHASHFLLYYEADEFVKFSSIYKKVVYTNKGYMIYTNLRVLLDECPELFVDFVSGTLSHCEEFTPAIDDPYKRYTFKIICNRGVSHELVRHRVFSFLQESTRYCNYSKDKFSNELNIINPFNNFITSDSNDDITNIDNIKEVYMNTLSYIENDYMYHIDELKLKAQEARGVLPNDLKTELYMSGFLKDWVGHNIETHVIEIFGEEVEVTMRQGFDTLRRHPSAHPQAKEIASLVFTDLIQVIGSFRFARIKETYY